LTAEDRNGFATRGLMMGMLREALVVHQADGFADRVVGSQRPWIGVMKVSTGSL
jgi:hypothetical protein